MKNACIFTLIFLFSQLFIFSQGIGNASKNLLQSNEDFGFRENLGQIIDQSGSVRNDVLYSGRCDNSYVYLTNDGFSFQFFTFLNDTFGDVSDKFSRNTIEHDSVSIQRIDVEWKNVNTGVEIEKGMQSAYTNYYTSSTSENKTLVKTFKSVKYTNLYDGIDLLFYYQGGYPVYDFIISPKSDPGLIDWEINGADEIFIDSAGKLVIVTPAGKIDMSAPIAHQEGKMVDVAWKLTENRIQFDVGSYNSELPLVIDPIMRMWGTYYGGSSNEFIANCVIDGLDNIYLTGHTTSSSNIATSGSFQQSISGNLDIFLVKIDSSGARKWGTFFGGTSDDYGFHCALDESYNIYVAGTAKSSGLSTLGAHQSTLNGQTDALLIKFDSSGLRTWATYFGGLSYDYGASCAIDKSSNIIMSGHTGSSGLIATPGAHQDSLSGLTDGFVAKFTPTGNRLWATYYGGSSNEYHSGCAVDDSNNVFLCGSTSSSDGIATISAYQSSIGGSTDAFLVKFDSLGVRQWGTYMGGYSDEEGVSCEVDAASNVYITGYSTSNAFIATAGSFQSSFGGLVDMFLGKFSSSGTANWITYFGGTSLDRGSGMFIDDSSNLYITGVTYSTSNIATPNTYQVNRAGQGYTNSDAFIVKFDSSGSRKWSTYYGSIEDEWGLDCVLDGNNNLILAGRTNSHYGITTAFSHQVAIGGGVDGFLVKFKHCFSYDTIAISDCYSVVSPSGKYTWTNSGVYTDTLINAVCGNLVTVEVNINNVQYILTQNGNELIASASSAEFQWINCQDSSILFGDTGHVFSPPVNGNYAVIIEQNGCTDTSECVSITSIGIEDKVDFDNIRVYPNPSDGLVNIDLGGLSNVNISVFSMDQQLMYHKTDLNSGVHQLDLEVSAGVYIVEIQSQSSTGYFRWVKDH